MLMGEIQSPSTSDLEQYQLMKPKPGTSHTEANGTSSTMMGYIITAPQAPFNSKSPKRRARHCSLMSRRGSVDIMLHRGAWSGRLSDKDFTG
jgi:hypothetical protein